MWLEKGWAKVAPLLTPLGYLYGRLMLLRRKAYQKGLFASYRPRAFVVSVGNLSLGGEGKTPLVLWLANLLREKGFRAAILTRGYRGKLRGPVVASRGEGPLFAPEEIGDEGYLLALKSSSPVMVARDRVQGAFWAIKEFEAEVLLLDDGFQHLRLERDLDLALFSARKDPFRERVFPAGRLREPLEVLSEADALVITKTNEAPEQGARLEERLRGFKKPVFKAPFETGAPYLLGERKARGEIPSPLLAFCGLGDPRSFLLAAEKTGELAGFISLPDHVAYTPKLIERLLSARKKAGATAFLTTEKDAVKLLPFVEKLQPCYVLPLEARPEKELEAFVLERLRKDRRL